ncbi:hypothetical protein M8J76_012065 [Diaphorina citri]|nr:hypothetical protein M8J76_012065 [Diaphorina citri]
MEKSTDEPCCSKSSDSSSKENEDPWLIGLAKNAVLHVKCSALEENPENPPAHRLHMTYKTHQAETKLLNALLTAHGMREVSFISIGITNLIHLKVFHIKEW